MKNPFDAEMLRFIEKNPTPYHVISAQKTELADSGFIELKESDEWDLAPGGKYYVSRNGSSLIAFQIPSVDWSGFHICASHCDSPALSIKENPEIRTGSEYTRLNVELYGGAIRHTWFDRPLSLGGRLLINNNGNIESVNVNMDRDLLMIPSLAIHMDRTINDGKKFSVQKDLLPVISASSDTDLMQMLADEAGVKKQDIAGCDLFVYNRQPYSSWGANGEFISSPRLDDCACVFSSFKAFLQSAPAERIAVHAIFDNEEVGSSSRAGAASTFLRDTLKRISLYKDTSPAAFIRDISGSFMLSADNAHAFHPNYPEKCDPVNKAVPGRGVVLKFSANKKYTTDGMSAAKVRLLAEEAGADIQIFVNHSDIPGGSTLGNISGNQIPLPCADIGLAQLAMHSSYETCGSGDAQQLCALLKVFFSK